MITSELVVWAIRRKIWFLPIVNVRSIGGRAADGGPAMLVGAPLREDGKLYNAAMLLDGGKIAAVRFKHDLPNYGVFDEKRVFNAGPLPGPVNFRGVRLGVMVCEDMWTDEVAECLQESGAEMLVVLNGSPYQQDKWDTRLNLAVARATECRMPLIYVNQVGGQDELVFDGASFVLGKDASLRVQAPAWEESLISTQWTRDGDSWACAEGDKNPPPDGDTAIYSAMVLGLKDYVEKSGFPGVIIGMSGGIDSALTAAVAVDALGPDRVHCVMMPSPYTSKESLDDAAEACRLLGARLIGATSPLWGHSTKCLPMRSPGPRRIRPRRIFRRARGLADGLVEQNRLDATDHRQQVGNVGRLCHAVRRYVRRVFGAQRRLQDQGVPALPLA